ncbi:probable cell surface glycoprotein [Streptomyces himastatinicus ATCC 53653]|uniref:Probable cell surface glycoprotein n=1 Tax=Streptomyces himastatinicus ATCC 53653 TaxID=457427 RepID=D9WPR3_9ACTN|nr:ferredoxin [Streptomyces himastatinicus]EFL23917.1 probable cell surface glycoprotein [Streptomyces himastatinicus ATCC 53653]
MSTTRTDHTPGWYVDDRCLNCNLARQYAPGLIGYSPGGPYGGSSTVLRQPGTEDEVRQLYMAAHACPTRSVHPPANDWRPGSDPYPMPLDEAGTVLLCGHAAPKTYGATSYLLRRPDSTAMMIDTPHWRPALARRYEEKAGKITDVLLTHLDHVAHGRQYADAFGARLWIHEGDLHSRPDADSVIRGRDPVEIGPGVIAHPFPGHTAGSTVFVADDTFCFSGDAFFWSQSQQDLEVADSVVYDSITTLAASVARGAEDLTFEWVLPGHGSFHRLPADEMRTRMRGLARRAATYPEQPVDYGKVRY